MIRLLLLSLLAIATLRAADTPPNIVMIISDDHLWSDYGFMGHQHLQTPNLQGPLWSRVAGQLACIAASRGQAQPMPGFPPLITSRAVAT